MVRDKAKEWMSTDCEAPDEQGKSCTLNSDDVDSTWEERWSQGLTTMKTVY